MKAKTLLIILLAVLLIPVLCSCGNNRDYGLEPGREKEEECLTARRRGTRPVTAEIRARSKFRQGSLPRANGTTSQIWNFGISL